MPIPAILYGILLPALLAGAVWGVAWRAWRRSAPPFLGGQWAGGIACAGALAFAYFMLLGRPAFPPLLAEDWLPYVACVAALIGVVENLAIRPLFARAVLWLALIAATVWVLLRNHPADWTSGQYQTWFACLVASGLVLQFVVELVAQRRAGASIPLSLWIWLASVAGALAATNSVKYGQLAGVLAAAMGAALVVAWVKPSISFARSTLTVLIPVAGGLLLCGYLYSYLPPNSAMILAAAPLTLCLGEFGFVSKRKPWIGVLVRAALVAIPSVWVAAMLLIEAWPTLFPPPGPPGPGY